MIRIIKEDRHSTTFTCPQSTKILSRALMEIVYQTTECGQPGGIRTHTEGHSHRASEIQVTKFFIFFVIIYYMGVIYIPSKSDYFITRFLWPKNKTIFLM